MQSKNYGNVEHLKAGRHAKDIQAYLDYYAIVGDDDGGKMMTDAEFEAYKKKLLEQGQIIYMYFTQIVREKNAKQ